MKLHLPILLYFVVQALGAQNLVPNGGFEQYERHQQSAEWTQAQYEFNHFYHRDFTEKMGEPASGNGYHCLCMYSREENEFMHVQLTQPLQKSHVYKLEMMVRLSQPTDDVYKIENKANMKRLDWYFTGIPLKVTRKLFITAEPSASFDFTAPTEWTQMSQEYVATGEEEYLTIGNITRIYEKLRSDEIMDSLQRRFYLYEKTESRLCDSVKNVRLSIINHDLIRQGQPASEFSMNPYVKQKKQKKKKLSRSQRRAYETEMQKYNQAMALVKQDQELIRKKYSRLRKELEDQVYVQEIKYAVNVCFDNISITEIPGKTAVLPDPIAGLKPQTGNTLVLKNVQFATDSYELLPASFTELDKLADWMQKNNGARILVSGHTDNTGKEKHNLELSGNRARAVVNYLLAKGIEAGRMQHKGFAAQFPLADNTSEQGKALNRRVEFTVM